MVFCGDSSQIVKDIFVIVCIPNVEFWLKSTVRILNNLIRLDWAKIVKKNYQSMNKLKQPIFF